MLVYGDRSEAVDPRAFAEALKGFCDRIARWPRGLAAHAAAVEALIEGGKLAQGLADAALAEDGCERWDSTQKQTVAMTMQLAARALVGPRRLDAASERFSGAIAIVLENPLPAQVVVREPEGYAFYALYPELYARAGPREDEAKPCVLGVRSIGASLGGVVGRGGPVFTVRPVGPPFAREIRLSAFLREAIVGAGGHGYLIVDEGPGASGSSFGAVADCLEDVGVPPDRIAFMPSHDGGLGSEASERHRRRWRSARKRLCDFKGLIEPKLAEWIGPLLPPLIQPLQELSAGRWREAVPGAAAQAPGWPERERRKYLAVTEAGRFLLKFAGLGATGRRKLEREQVLHAADFAPEPMGLAHGFLLERWAEGEPLAPDQPEVVGRYLGYRARALEPPRGAADDGALRAMMVRNFDLAGLTALSERVASIPAGRRGPPCAIDGRLHAWEWRRAGEGRWVKLDALDHCEAHDLVGAQDLAWDLAGAAVELGLGGEAGDLLRRVAAEESGQAVDPRRIAFSSLAYLAFQIGWWTLASQGAGGAGAWARRRFYENRTRSWSPAP